MPRQAKLPQILRTSSAWSDHLLAVEHGHVESGIVWGISRNACTAQAKGCLWYVRVESCVCIYNIYIYYVWWCSLSSFTIHISPQTSQTKYLKYTKTVQDSSQSSFILGNSQWSFLRVFFFRNRPASCKVWGYYAAPALRGAKRCHRTRALIFQVWTSQRLFNGTPRWVQLEDQHHFTIVRKAPWQLFFRERFNRKIGSIPVYLYNMCNMYI